MAQAQKVKRYMIAGVEQARWMEQHPAGDYVLYSDYEATAKLAKDTVSALRKARARWVQAGASPSCWSEGETSDLAEIDAVLARAKETL